MKTSSSPLASHLQVVFFRLYVLAVPFLKSCHRSACPESEEVRVSEMKE